MKEELVNDSFYIGFEGQPEILILFDNLTEKNILKMWNGYFETLLDLMCQYEPSNEGILHEYYAHEGWYEESPWEIQNLDAAIHLFKSFDMSKLTGEQIENSENIIPALPEVAQRISTFLEAAKSNGSNVYIVYD
ncbi:hypothetical protein [Paenibacillus xylanivorans]|uniref:Uncharacterized protein n=1 Tax=Paenibacillus xylanivorans TaxID=1705561 RepID=A0A0N0C3H1_9BACL|nr:hypothetical protein [Paenibacillus xylanivorans]KOY14297.1 hypothetical protein AMS66_20030 [Paenibacillus xylanivorans]